MQDPTFERLTTERLVIRRFTVADADAFASYRSDEDVSRYQDWDCPYPVLDAETFIAAMQHRDPGAPDGWFQFAVTLSGPRSLIGDVALGVDRVEPRHAELGFTFAAGSQRQGYATEAVRAVVEYAFSTLAMHRVSSRTDTRNLRAQHLLERLGFRREGESRESIWFKGAWATDLIYAQLASEWGRPICTQ